MDGSPKDQLVEKLKSANNVLVTVSRDPSVDQLASLLGLTLLLNKQGKHAAAVYSGDTPSTIEFLQPDETIEKNTDSLRDFIIALDKSKADKLRYKVEDNVVRIFITPYKTSLSEEDFEFSQGDFNIDLVVAIGVKQQEDLDEAITAHGRILHDAVVASINVAEDGGVGSINWHDPQASSLSELVTNLVQAVGADQLDNQIATALLTGIVAETERFSNDKTSSQTMSASAALMAAGANQQLVASKLEEPEQPAAESDDQGDGGQDGEAKPDDGTLEIDHQPESSDSGDDQPAEPNLELPEPSMTPESEPEAAAETESEAPPVPEETAPAPAEDSQSQFSSLSAGSQIITEPPSMGGTLTANTVPEGMGGTTDPMSDKNADTPGIIERTPEPASETPSAAPNIPVNPTGTLTDIEQSIGSPHVQPENLDNMRDEVNKALVDTPFNPTAEPVQSLNAQPLGDGLHADPVQPAPAPAADIAPAPETPQVPAVDTPVTEVAPPAEQPAVSPEPTPAEAIVTDPNAPPPVPPPIPFQFGAAANNTQPNQQ